MFKKINQYLLTHHPLLWNTKIVQVLCVNALVHFFFFVAGWASVHAKSIQEDYYYFFNGGLIAFSVLCSIVVLVGWLVFYLRNNAFKSFYQLGKWHLVKEFGLILLVVFSSIVYLESYSYGERVKARSITSYAQLVQEVNTCNLAKAFIPTDKSDYFVLNGCDDMASNIGYSTSVDYQDTLNNDRNDSNFIRIRKAMRQTNAFSYLHYCRAFTHLDDTLQYNRGRKINSIVNNWVLNKQQDSIAAIIAQAVTIGKKYDIEMALDPAALAALPFLDSNHTVSRLVKTDRYNSELEASPYYFDSYALNRAFSYLDECNTHNKNNRHWERLLVELYFTLGIGVLLLCYRRFSKKVFLISVIGAGVWCIILGIVAASSRSETVLGVLYLLLFGIFTAIAMTGLAGKNSKTVTGVLLNWHIYMIPTVLMAIAMLIVSNYHDAPHLEGVYDSAVHCRNYPIGCWINDHFGILAWANLLFSLLYTTFVFNRLGKQWHIMPDE